MTDRYIYIYGRHTVREALQYRPDTISALYLRDDVRDVIEPALRQSVQHVEYFSGKAVPVKLDDGAVHQGVIAKLDRQALLMPYDTFKVETEFTSHTAIAILGELHDPHNVGAIIRSAAAFGLTAIMVPKHRQASVTAAVLKVSVGMGFRIPLIEIGNVNRTLTELKQLGCFVYGLAGDAPAAVPLPQEEFTKPTVFVIGNEGEGLREKTRDHCDTLLAIPIHERTESLNASVSAAVTFYAWSTQHPTVVMKAQ